MASVELLSTPGESQTEVINIMLFSGDGDSCSAARSPFSAEASASTSASISVFVSKPR